ncbi:MAG: Phosphoribosyltransferase [Candidatus Wolfebacteria bacterium GW2011_GWC1_43_10]|uniref:Phosphoribosyltransferase n=2 Tax=Candidatus Wolfeibacteriota TaxID=1752735 RepID=A0A0G1EI41_9BACT|nr:MAG: Phosphoribosyltransferase [Candidatus Wolfebacteria bacterium GW2011_GWC1_43_10]
MSFEIITVVLLYHFLAIKKMSWRNFLTKAKNFVLDALFPPICLNCSTPIQSQKDFLCPLCFDLLEINSSFYCPKCGGRITDPSFSCHPQTQCLLAPAGAYFPPLPALIHYFKYKKLAGVSSFLTALLIVYLKRINFEIGSFQITYIPLYPFKERKRGFNQSQILAQGVANYFSLPLVKALKRIRDTRVQAKNKNSQDRQKNVFGCFVPADSETIKGKNFLLVDDVYTSGATVSEAVRVLKENGARKVIVLVAAKA